MDTRRGLSHLARKQGAIDKRKKPRNAQVSQGFSATPPVSVTNSGTSLLGSDVPGSRNEVRLLPDKGSGQGSVLHHLPLCLKTGRPERVKVVDVSRVTRLVLYPCLVRNPL